MNKREEMWARVHELACTHKHIRADECPICRKQFAEIIEQVCEAENKAEDKDENGDTTKKDAES